MNQQEFDRLIDLYPSQGSGDDYYLSLAKKRAWKTFPYLPKGTGKERLLDVGSFQALYGPLYIEQYGYREVAVVGTDVVPGSVIRRDDPKAGKSYSFEAQACNIEKEPLPFPDERFDTVVITEVVEHLLMDPVYAMNEVNRVLKPGGKVLFSVPNAASDECLTYLVNNQQPGFLRAYLSNGLIHGNKDLNTVYEMGHYHEYTSREVQALVDSCGFAIEQMRGLSYHEPHLEGWRWSLLKSFVSLLFPRSQRIREDVILAVLTKKGDYVPLDQLPNRFPEPLYRTHR